jgi:PAS domain S-box-containing protein
MTNFIMDESPEKIQETKMKNTALDSFSSPDYYKVYFETAHHGIAYVDAQGYFIDVNDALCNILGRTRDELKQTSFQSITYGLDLKNDVMSANSVIRGNIKAYGMDKRYIGKDNECLIPCHIEVRRIPWDQNIEFEHFKVDIYYNGPIQNLVRTKEGLFKVKVGLMDVIKDFKGVIAVLGGIGLLLAFAAGEGGEFIKNIIELVRALRGF